MAVSKLNLVHINFERDRVDEVLMKLLQVDNFHPELASKFIDSVTGLRAYNQENLLEELIEKFEHARKQYDLDVKELDVNIKDINLLQTKDKLFELFNKVEQIESVCNQLQVVVDENKEAIIQLEHIKNMDVNFDDLFSCKYLQIRFGKLPTSNVNKLDYYETLPFIYREFHDDGKYTWCMYITTPAHVLEIDNIFSSVYFERIQIPTFVHGEPELAIEEIQEESKVASENIEKLKQRILDQFHQYETEINQFYTLRKHAKKLGVFQDYVVILGDKLQLVGFVPKKESKKFKQDLESIAGVNVEIHPEKSDSRLIPPTKLNSNWFVRPFKMFVEMYGMPSYDDIDPTVFVALSYSLLFGIMFGDLGQGIVLSIVGFLAWKLKGMELGAVGMRLGISSAIFGIIFGSVFGDEEILVPIFHAMAAQNIMPLLLSAVGLGICLNMISMLLNIYINFKKKNLCEALFSKNGIAGFVFYTSVLLIVLNMFIQLPSFIGSKVYMILFILIPLLLVFMKESIERKMEQEPMFPDGFGGYAMQGFFELFEVCLSFVTNTMSFLRVGGFVLSHGGMMLVVYTLANMVGGMGYWIVLVFGNIFVMCLEGLIVGIQVLRLEFYEMFSRYYEGNGIPFKTIKEQ